MTWKTLSVCLLIIACAKILILLDFQFISFARRLRFDFNELKRNRPLDDEEEKEEKGVKMCKKKSFPLSVSSRMKSWRLSSFFVFRFNITQKKKKWWTYQLFLDHARYLSHWVISFPFFSMSFKEKYFLRLIKND